MHELARHWLYMNAESLEEGVPLGCGCPYGWIAPWACALDFLNFVVPFSFTKLGPKWAGVYTDGRGAMLDRALRSQ